MGKSYSARVKFKVALAALNSGMSQAEIAEAYGVHPSTVSSWKKEVLKKGPEIFATESTIVAYERRIADLEQLVGQLERLVGQKEVEITRLKRIQELPV